ncbi:MAG: DUF3426 domain-containing protein [Pseudomonadota bacterium]|nr:DUF3426 domain-containing protein [Pseudomonadota bacterium]
MLTCCPACRTCFRITEAQLAVAQGKVRCGKCKTVFNAKQHLQPIPGQETPAASTATSAPPAAAAEQSKQSEPSRAPKSEKPAPTPDRDEAAPAGTPSEPKPSAAPESSSDQPATAEAESPRTPMTPPEPPVEPEPESEPQTVEIPMPDLDEPQTDTPGESPADSQSVSEPEPEAPQAASDADSSRYRYNDFTDEVLSDKELDDILAEMDQQLSLGIDNPDTELPGSLAMPEEPPPPKQDELGEAIDSLFDDLQREPSADEEPVSSAPETTEEAGTATTGSDEDAAVPTAFEEVSTDRDTGPREEPDQDEWTDTTELSPTADAEPEPEPVPLRLRDSLAIEPPKPRSWLATLGGGLLILLLLALLLAQLALFRPLDVVRFVPQSQPWLERFCQHLPCHFTPYRDTDHIRLLNRDVRAHPKQEGALLISATLVNEAEVAQAYPAVRVTLFDLSGNRMAQRRFTPADYLGERHSPFMQMQPDTPLQIKLEVADPGSEAVNFEFDFQ